LQELPVVKCPYSSSSSLLFVGVVVSSIPAQPCHCARRIDAIPGRIDVCKCMGFSTLKHGEIRKHQCINSAVYKCNLHMCDPEATETFQKLPKPSRSYRNLPEATYTFQKLPKPSRSFLHIPEATETFQKLPRHSRSFPGTACMGYPPMNTRYKPGGMLIMQTRPHPGQARSSG